MKDADQPCDSAWLFRQMMRNATLAAARTARSSDPDVDLRLWNDWFNGPPVVAQVVLLQDLFETICSWQGRKQEFSSFTAPFGNYPVLRRMSALGAEPRVLQPDSSFELTAQG
jgi:hypothetical protein